MKNYLIQFEWYRKLFPRKFYFYRKDRFVTSNIKGLFQTHLKIKEESEAKVKMLKQVLLNRSSMEGVYGDPSKEYRYECETIIKEVEYESRIISRIMKGDKVLLESKTMVENYDDIKRYPWLKWRHESSNVAGFFYQLLEFYHANKD